MISKQHTVPFKDWTKQELVDADDVLCSASLLEEKAAHWAWTQLARRLHHAAGDEGERSCRSDNL
jgi:hypothetical protein